MDKKARVLELRPATPPDFDVAWETWAEAVRPYVAPRILEKFSRRWDDADEKQRFASWWKPDATMRLK